MKTMRSRLLSLALALVLALSLLPGAALTGLSYEDATAVPGTEYRYFVRGVNGLGNGTGAYSDYAKAR